MSGMIDRVADAISDCDKWGDVSYELSLEMASAAIEAMREPTPDLLDSPSYLSGEWSRRDIEAYIDAALGDKKRRA